MKKNNEIKKISYILMIFGTVLLQGCFGYSIDCNPTNQSISAIPLYYDKSKTSSMETRIVSTEKPYDNYEQIYLEIDMNRHMFAIKCENNDNAICLEGKLLTYDYPETANVYKISPRGEEWEVFYNPIKDWQRINFHELALLSGKQKYAEDMDKDYQLSRLERNSVICSTTRMNISDVEQMEKIRDAYPNIDFGCYVLKYTYPAIESNLYEIEIYDIKQKRAVIVDTIKERSFAYYVVRRSIDDITVGLPHSTGLYYSDYDDEKKLETHIYNEEYYMFYDGVDIYEVHNNNKADTNDIVLFLDNQPLLNFEQSIEKAEPTISRMVSDYVSENRDIHIYAAELVYLTVQVSDINNEEFSFRDSGEAYLYPFWVIYIHSNYVISGHDIADCKPILINAITGEVISCN